MTYFLKSHDCLNIIYHLLFETTSSLVEQRTKVEGKSEWERNCGLALFLPLFSCTTNQYCMQFKWEKNNSIVLIMCIYRKFSFFVAIQKPLFKIRVTSSAKQKHRQLLQPSRAMSWVELTIVSHNLFII